MGTETLNTEGKTNGVYEKELSDWIDQERKAIDLIGLVGKLWFERSVETILFRKQLVDRSASEILNLHLYSKDIIKKPVSINDTITITQEVANAEINHAKIDIGKLTYEWLQEKDNFESAAAFVGNKLKDFVGEGPAVEPTDVVLFGFGRIGRIAARELVAQAGKGQQLRLKAIVTRGNTDKELTKRADLLRTDSVHGPFPGTIIEDFEKKALIINGHTVYMVESKNPEDMDYTEYGIKDALVIDNTGVFRDDEQLGRHIKAKGVDKVLLTAPAAGSVANVVYGVNQHTVDVNKEKVYSAASCTTNAIMPVLKVINESLGIQRGHIETVHSYTNDQNLLDNFHKKYRRGRSAPINMVITETGAESALKKVLPELSGKFSANSVRVPTPNVSLAIISLTINKEVTLEEVNGIMNDAAFGGPLVEQIDYVNSNEFVSSDVIGNSSPSVFDSQATIVGPDKKNIVLYVWYDNEYGYTRQVIRFAKHITEVKRNNYY